MFLTKIHRGCRGFTVTEMVMVLAVIFFLASVLIPALLKARESGRSARCVGNLKNLIQGVRLYVEDESLGRFPDLSPDTDLKDMMTLLLPYLSSSTSITSLTPELQVFRCPSNADTSNSSNRIDAYGNQTDYGYNSNLDNGVAQTKIGSPEWAAVLWDYPPWPASPSANIHRGGSNIAFYDGHVQWYSRAQMQEAHAPDTGTQYNTWGIN